MRLFDLIENKNISNRCFFRKKHGNKEFVLFLIDGYIYIADSKTKESPGMWTPSIDDLKADDWCFLE